MASRNRRTRTGWLDLLSLIPWWLCLLLAVASYLLLHGYAGTRLDPRAAGTPPADFLAGSLFRGIAAVGQYLLPMAFVLAAIASGARSVMARKLAAEDPPEPADAGHEPYADWKDDDRAVPELPAIDTRQWNLPLLKALDWKRFELVCAAYFEAIGFRAQTTVAGPDGGVDIHLFEKGAERPGIVVQCKAWRNVPVGVALVRELLGVMTAANVAEGIVATVGTFTAEAKAFATGKDMHLIDGEDFLAKLRSLSPERQAGLLAFATEGDFTTPTCPSCGIGHRMKLRTSGKDGTRFWGCGNFPRCRATLQAGNSLAGRAS